VTYIGISGDNRTWWEKFVTWLLGRRHLEAEKNRHPRLDKPSA